jgi:hypothetical protein
MMFTATEKRECAEREFKMRLQVYPRRVADGKMSAAKAERELAVMAAIIEDYRILEGGERLL